jgi:hypothetical protein
MANKVKLMGAVVAIGALGATGAAVGFADDIDRTLSSNEDVQQEVQQLVDGTQQQPAEGAGYSRDFYWGPRGYYYGPRVAGPGYGPAYGPRWVPGAWGGWGYRRGAWVR